MAAIRVTTTPAAIDNQSKVHLIPCKIKVSGEARVNEYFESTIRKVQRKSIDSSGLFFRKCQYKLGEDASGAIIIRQTRVLVLNLPAGAAPTLKKWGGQEVKLIARRYT